MEFIVLKKSGESFHQKPVENQKLNVKDSTLQAWFKKIITLSTIYIICPFTLPIDVYHKPNGFKCVALHMHILNH